MVAPLLLERLAEDDLTASDLVRLLSQGPMESLGLEAQRLVEGQTADLTVLDPTRPWTVTPEALASRGKNTPFQGHRFTGRATLTIVAGEVVYTAPLGEEMS